MLCTKGSTEYKAVQCDHNRESECCAVVFANALHNHVTKHNLEDHKINNIIARAISEAFQDAEGTLF